MSQPTLSSEDIIRTLHQVFDEQIMNYGAYNLVFATGSAIYRNPDISASQQKNQEYFLIGYRDSPREVVLAPTQLPAVKAAGTPTSIDNTNTMRIYPVNDSTFGIESTNGTSFILSLTPLMEVATETGAGVLDQSEDTADFQKFLEESWSEEPDLLN